MAVLIPAAQTAVSLVSSAFALSWSSTTTTAILGIALASLPKMAHGASQTESSPLPNGQVAFFPGPCPDGWSPLHEQMNLDGDGHHLRITQNPESAGKVGGDTQPTLEEKHLPSHAHGFVTTQSGQPGSGTYLSGNSDNLEDKYKSYALKSADGAVDENFMTNAWGSALPQPIPEHLYINVTGCVYQGDAAKQWGDLVQNVADTNGHIVQINGDIQQLQNSSSSSSEELRALQDQLKTFQTTVDTLHSKLLALQEKSNDLQDDGQQTKTLSTVGLVGAAAAAACAGSLCAREVNKLLNCCRKGEDGGYGHVQDGES